MVHTWESIKDAALALRISERQAWRWLQSGKLTKKDSSDGKTTISLAADITDSPDVMTCHDSVTDIRTDMSQSPVSVSRRPPVDVIGLLTEELKTVDLEFQIDKLIDARERWLDRRDRERDEEVVPVVQQENTPAPPTIDHHIDRSDEIRQAALDNKRRSIINKVKSIICPDIEKQVLPAHITAQLLSEISRFLVKVDVLSIPIDELVIFAHDFKTRIWKAHEAEIRESMWTYVNQIGKEVITNEIMNAYQQYRKGGGKLSFNEYAHQVLT